jgi:hypothetical protein
MLTDNLDTTRAVHNERCAFRIWEGKRERAMNRDPAVLEQRIQHLVVTAPILPAAKVDHDIDLLGNQLAMPGLKKEIWTIIKADRFLTDDEVRFKIWDLVSRICSA